MRTKNCLAPARSRPGQLRASDDGRTAPTIERMAEAPAGLRSPALCAKSRERGPSVLERQAAEQAELDSRIQKPSARVEPAGAARKAPAVTGGKSVKTGMVLARAQLCESESGVVVARDRRSALVSKGRFREAEKVAREQAVGTLATKDMPKRKNAEAPAAHKRAFGEWMRSALASKVRRRGMHARTAVRAACRGRDRACTRGRVSRARR